MSNLPVCRHPALTVLVDDSQSFLDSVTFRLDGHTYKTFTDARAAIDWLRQASQQTTCNADKFIQVEYEEGGNASFTRRSASIKLDPILSTVCDKIRFETPAVLVVDYAMPDINGLELCAMASNLPCAKILLTGQAGEQTAIEAFNRQLIDGYISKNDPQAMVKLEAAIEKHQQNYFTRKTAALRNLLARHSYTFLSDPAIAALIEQIYDRYHFVEHYLFPHPEGFMLLDAQGDATVMVVANKDNLTSQAEIAQHEGAPADLVDALMELRLVPFFSDGGGFYHKEIGNDWVQYCLPAQICQGRETYYWALFELPRHYLAQPIYSYAEFKRQRLDE